MSVLLTVNNEADIYGAGTPHPEINVILFTPVVMTAQLWYTM